MPTVIVEAIEGRTAEQKRGLARDFTEAVVKHFNVRPEQVTIIIHDLKLEDVAKSGTLFSDSRP
jgi:4-oxalocrotonate tautomerase